MSLPSHLSYVADVSYFAFLLTSPDDQNLSQEGDASEVGPVSPRGGMMKTDMAPLSPRGMVRPLVKKAPPSLLI